jgi:putative ABC transport system permease protein
MSGSVQTIPLIRLAIAFLPVVVVIGVYIRWAMDSRTLIYASSRMLIQLLLIGYVLTHIFKSNQAWVVLAVLSVMLMVASWIALRPLAVLRPEHYRRALAAIAIGGISTLLFITQIVLSMPKWYQPDYLIPLAGMVFSNAMNAVSLAAERFQAECDNSVDYLEARRAALRASLIPMVNSFFAVGLVSLPGMMTGQILSGVSPLIAVRYQIVVMCMIFGAAGMSSACYLQMMAKAKNK